jgi:aminoglycoside 3-N-acetyltransferase
MGEQGAIDAAGVPVTQAQLCDDLRMLGVEGLVLLVHSSLSSLGWVPGAAQAVVLALVEAVGPQGTIVMPTHSGTLTEPSRWANPPVPESWWPVIRAETPAYDALLTPTRGMGAIVECFRHLPGVRRSAHPHDSFAASGPRAAEVTDNHALSDGLGETSPLARVYELDGWVLLLGVGHGNNTSLHLAEYRADYPGKSRITQGAPMTVDGQRRWVTYPDIDNNSDDFDGLGDDFAATGRQREGQVGRGRALLMRQRDIVDFGVEWFPRHRGRAASS